MIITEMTLANYIDEDLDAVYANGYELYYRNLSNLILDMSEDWILGDIGGIDDSIFDQDFDPNENAHLRKIRRWLKSFYGNDIFFGKNPQADLPWINVMVVDGDTFQEYLSVFIREMGVARDFIFEKWTEAIGRAPEGQEIAQFIEDEEEYYDRLEDSIIRFKRQL
jgi:hypothetical protein